MAEYTISSSMRGGCGVGLLRGAIGAGEYRRSDGGFRGIWKALQRLSKEVIRRVSDCLSCDGCDCWWFDGGGVVRCSGIVR